MIEKEIGDEGNSRYASKATSALNRKADDARLSKYDEYVGKAKKQKIRHLIWVLIFLPITAKLIMDGSYWWAILPGIVTLFNLWMAKMSSSSHSKEAFTDGLLTPAIVCNLEPLQLAAMAEMQSQEEYDRCLGIKIMTIKQLPDHELKIGERVPCVSLFGAPTVFSGLWMDYEPRPISWGIDDKAVIQSAMVAIPGKDWEDLEALTPVAQAHPKAEKDIIYFNEDLTERTDLIGYYDEYKERVKQEESED